MVGAAAALRLQAAGLRVTLIDPGDNRRGASFGNAGHIATEQVEPLSSWATLKSFPQRLFLIGGPLDFRVRDAGLWLPWALRFIAASERSRFERGTQALSALQAQAMSAWYRLAMLADAPELVRAEGHNVVWMSAAAAKRGVEAWGKAKIGTTTFREMEKEELEPYRRALKAMPAAGLKFSGSGQFVEPQATRDGVLAAFRARGGKEIKGSVAELTARDSGVTAWFGSGEAVQADEVLIAAGAWSARVMASLDVYPPLVAERGYSVQSEEHEWPETLPPTFFEERSLYVVRFSSGLRATSFLELGDPDPPGDERKWRWLERQVSELGISFSKTPDRWRGPRPTLPDFLPAIGRMERHPRVLYAFGHQHLGMTLSAITAELIEALVTGAAPKVDLSPFRVERFG
jgi:D-amino-acid dehydrogenase